MGLVGIDKAALKECGALTLDMLLKFGILEQDGDGMWQLTENWEAKRAFLVGAVKTVDNTNKIAEDLSNRPLSLKESSQQAEVFAKALKNVMTIPGDWHAGLTMLQSIMNVFWDGFIEPFVKALKWKKVYKDCRNCYYRTSSVVLLVHNELIGHLMQTYVSEFGEPVRSKFENEEADKSPESYICYFAESFASWVDELANGDDNWLKACCLFITMSKDFFTFVDSYRSADAIGVEMGYQAFVAVWRALGQTRYLERHWRQQEQMLSLHPFSWLEMLRRYRFVRKYHGSTGKGTLAMDEMLELANRFYSQFPKVRTLEAFARQGNYIGLAIMCKRMVLTVGTNTKYQSSHVYRSGSTPKIIAEKVKIYEIFTLLRTSHVTPLWQFKKYRV